jgi:hypothetical protein
MQTISENTTINTWMTENFPTTQLSVARWKKLQNAEYLTTLNKDVNFLELFVLDVHRSVFKTKTHCPVICEG